MQTSRTIHTVDLSTQAAYLNWLAALGSVWAWGDATTHGRQLLLIESVAQPRLSISRTWSA